MGRESLPINWGRLFRYVVMKCKWNKIAGKQNQTYRSIIKRLLSKKQRY